MPAFRTREPSPQGSITLKTMDVSELKHGAGEGIRTLDPNLGKVVLYL